MVGDSPQILVAPGDMRFFFTLFKATVDDTPNILMALHFQWICTIHYGNYTCPNILGIYTIQNMGIRNVSLAMAL